MQTKLLMVSSAVLLGILGLVMTFAPDRVVVWCGSSVTPAVMLVVQAAGALYFGFALLNWMAKDNLIGGIYSRPVALGNLLHFFATAMALIRAVSTGTHGGVILILTFVYVIFAIWFGLVLFGSPVRARTD